MLLEHGIQHQASRTCLSRLFQTFILLPTCQKPFLDRRKSGLSHKARATTRRLGAAGRKVNFTRPEWLLPVQEEANGAARKEPLNTFLYQVILTTSKDYDSGMSDLNACIMLAFIGEEGRCFVYKIPNLFSPNPLETLENSQELYESRHSVYSFQRGGQDVVTFIGPDLGRLEAVWVAPQRGTWRIQGITVRVFPNLSDKEMELVTGSNDFKSFQYNFELEETLIGENVSASAAEILVSSVVEISNEARQVDANKLASQSKTSLTHLRDEGLKEYEVLKLSLLVYDALLVVAGGAITATVGYREVTKGYLIGGILGFLYLFILGITVDQLPALSNQASLLPKIETNEEKITAENKSDAVHMNEENLQLMRSFKNFRAPLTKLSGVLAICVVIVKAINPTSTQEITKEMLFAGVAGFLMTKLATYLASYIPLSLK